MVGNGVATGPNVILTPRSFQCGRLPWPDSRFGAARRGTDVRESVRRFCRRHCLDDATGNGWGTRTCPIFSLPEALSQRKHPHEMECLATGSPGCGLDEALP